MKKHKFIAPALISVWLFLMLAACGQQSDDVDTQQHSLSILAPALYTTAIRNAEQSMARALEARGIEFTVELTSYGLSESEGQRTRLQTMLMAGHGYDLFFWDYHPTRAYVYSGFLTDFYTLMDNNTFTSRGDFFTNVLQAYEINGGLYTFPITFGFEFVGINTNLPQSIIRKFEKNESITIDDMLSLYTDLLDNYIENFGHFVPFSSNTLGMPFNMAAIRMTDFIDFDNNVSRLNSQPFIDFLENFYRVNRNRGLFDFTGWLSNVPNREMLTAASFNTAFLVVNSHLNPMLALFDQVRPYFTNFIPLSTEDGSLIINPQYISFPGSGSHGSTWAKVAIPANGDGQLAWEFIQHLIPAMINYTESGPGSPSFLSFGQGSLVSPITVADFEPHVRNVLNIATTSQFILQNMVPFANISENLARTQAIEDAIATLAALNKLPVSIIEGHNIPTNILIDTFTSFLLGLASAEETAQEIHNRISLWLIE